MEIKIIIPNTVEPFLLEPTNQKYVKQALKNILGEVFNADITVL